MRRHELSDEQFKKIERLVDGLGNPVDFILTGGEVHDSICADTLLDDKDAAFVIADKAYDSDKVLTPSDFFVN